LILLIGFLLLRVSLPLFFALGIAVLDALPLFGTGTALLPWSLFSMISGDLHLGLGLLILYAVCALSRNVLEPKLLGAQLGVSPLLTLLAIYVGYRVSGFGGMLLLPILTLVGMQLWEARQKNISP
jgi:predicted PurR-regulated permease PerM